MHGTPRGGSGQGLYLRLLPSSSNRYCTLSHCVALVLGGGTSGTKALWKSSMYLSTKQKNNTRNSTRWLYCQRLMSKLLTARVPKKSLAYQMTAFKVKGGFCSAYGFVSYVFKD